MKPSKVTRNTTHFPKLKISLQEVKMGNFLSGTLVSPANYGNSFEERTAFITPAFMSGSVNIPQNWEGIDERLRNSLPSEETEALY